MFLKYFLLKNPKAEGQFMPNTKPGYNYSVRKFLAYLCRNNPAIKLNTYREVFQSMITAAEDILIAGDSILVPGIIKISPAVKGVFDSLDENYKSPKHSIGVNCTVLPEFSRRISDRAKVKKINTPQKVPAITGITENSTKARALHPENANLITGIFLKPKKEKLNALNLYTSGGSRNIVVEIKEINIIKHTDKEIMFIFKRSFTPPGWLVNGTEISVQLHYESTTGDIAHYKPYKAKWIC